MYPSASFEHPCRFVCDSARCRRRLSPRLCARRHEFAAAGNAQIGTGDEHVWIDIVAIGSHGDVQPSLAFGLGLTRAGHRVRLVTLGGFESFVRSYGCEHLSIGHSLREIRSTLTGLSWIERRGGTVGYLRGLIGVANAQIEAGIAKYWADCGEPDAIFATAMGCSVAAHVAERLRAPLIKVSFAPTRYEWEGRTDIVTAIRKGTDRTASAAYGFLLWNGLRRATNRARREVLNLPPLPVANPFRALDRHGVPTFDAYSAVVAAAPSAACQSIHVTGYWFLDDAPRWAPPADLVDFLQAGPPPVFVGFGSTPFPSPDTATEDIISALAQSRQRCVIVSGGSGLPTGRLNDDVLSVDAVPHSWLLPQAAAAVHHGGAGVTGAALRAGLASVVVPIFGDQPFWARRLFELGVAARPIAAKRLTRQALSEAIRQVTSDARVRERAASIGRGIRGEDGVARAVQVFHEYIASRPLVRR